MKVVARFVVAPVVAVAVLSVAGRSASRAESETQACEVEELVIELNPPRDCLLIVLEHTGGSITNQCEARVDLEDWPISGRERNLTLYPREHTSFQMPYADELDDGVYPFDVSLRLQVSGEPTRLDMTGQVECSRSSYSFDPGEDGSCSVGGTTSPLLAALVMAMAIAVARRRRAAGPR